MTAITWSGALASLLAAVALATADPARADALFYTGEYQIRFSFNGAIETVSATGSGVALVNNGNVGGHLTTLELTGPFASITEMLTGSSATGLRSVEFQGVRVFRKMSPFAGSANLPGVFAPIFTAAQSTAVALTRNTLPVGGTVVFCKTAPFLDCEDPKTVPLSQADGGLAIGPGVGGMFTETYPDPPTTTTIMATGQPWTIHNTMVNWTSTTPISIGAMGVLSDTGYAHGPTSAPSSTAIPGGVVKLVSGLRMTSTLPANKKGAFLGSLKITFTPEPRLLLLLGTGSACLALLGHRRSRRAQGAR